jgi:hypothetical protein
VIEVNESWEQTAVRTLRALYEREPEPSQCEEWIGFMKILLKGIKPDQQFVYLDGWVIPTTANHVRIEGWHSQHNLEFVPQVAALHDPEIRTSLLSSREYWGSTAIEDERA